MWIRVRIDKNACVEVNFSLVPSMEVYDHDARILLADGTYYSITREEHDRIRKILGVIDGESRDKLTT